MLEELFGEPKSINELLKTRFLGEILQKTTFLANLFITKCIMVMRVIQC